MNDRPALRQILPCCNLPGCLLRGIMPEVAAAPASANRSVRCPPLPLCSKSVSQQDKGLKAKLADFGLAKNFLEAGLSRFSCENEIKGTMNFMAPEQVADSRYATPQSDLFSVGATLYTLITSQPLYDDCDRSAPIAKILHDGPIPIEKRLPNIPAELKNILRCALAFEPANRFRNADEMREALAELAGG